MNRNIESLPFWKKIIYALGQFGWSLASFGVANLLVYFYSPPVREGAETPMFPVFIAAAAVIGVIGGISRLFDAVTDPLIAGFSDRSQSSMGRRRKFLAIGVFPFALLSLLVFVPPVQGGSMLNTAWVFVTIILFYFFMTMYVTPFFALMSELGHTPNERLQLSTMISITWALGFLAGNTVYVVQGIFEGILSGVPITPAAPPSPEIATLALQITLGIFAVIAFIFMLLPVLFIDEKRYCEDHVSSEGSFEALKTAFQNRAFRYFAISDLSYWLAMTFVATGISFYVIMLLGLEKEMATALMTVMFLCSFLFYIPIALLAKKFGKKRILGISFILFIAAAFMMASWGLAPLSPEVQGFAVMIFSAFPIAAFGILPNAIVADIADADGIENGNFKAAIFFGARTFMSKLGQSLTLFLFPLISTIALGSADKLSKAQAIDMGLEAAASVSGVRLTAIAAAIALVAGFLLFLLYDEKHVLSVIKSREESEK
jgi:Na+/melibiose symporter-like transporter